MASDGQVRQLLELSKACMTTTVDQVIANTEWGVINFEAGRVELERTFTILSQFQRLPIGFLSDRILQRIIDSVLPLKASLDQMRGFSVTQDDPVGARDQLLAQYARQAAGFFGTALLYNCLSCLRNGQYSERFSCPACQVEE